MGSGRSPEEYGRVEGAIRVPSSALLEALDEVEERGPGAMATRVQWDE